jgi:hypothetical protein
MRRSASEIIINLERRIARLERQSGDSSELEKVLDKYLDLVKTQSRTKATFDGENRLVTRASLEGEMPTEYNDESTVIAKSLTYMYVLLDEEETPDLCSRIKRKDSSLKGELNKFFASKSGKIVLALEKRGVVEALKNRIYDWSDETNRNLDNDEYISLDKWLMGGIGAVSAGYEVVSGKCYVVINARAQQSAKLSYVVD